MYINEAFTMTGQKELFLRFQQATDKKLSDRLREGGGRRLLQRNICILK